MRRSLCLLFGLGIAAVAYADPIWTVPGRYQVADTDYGMILWKGPFDDEDSCKATLPPNEQEADYGWQYLGERPSYDD